jgi:predicted permease
MINSLLQDLRYACRMLVRNLGFTTVALLALAIGIAVDTAVFTAYRAMVARKIDARNPDRMVNVALVRTSGAAAYTFSYPDYAAYRDALHSFSGLVAFSPEHITLSGAGGVISQRASETGSLMGRLGLLPSGVSNAEFAIVFVVSENYFEVLGVPAERGRVFESRSGSPLAASPSVLIGDNYWQKRFNRDPAILGKTIRLNGAAVQIVGVTPHDFVGTGVLVPDFWLPVSLEPLVHADKNFLTGRENQNFRLFGRLAPGVAIGEAQAEMNVVADRLRTQHDSRSDSAKPAKIILWPASPFPLPLKYYAGLKLTFLLIMLAAAMLLVVACANVASLQLARSRSRVHELQTRLSLGASRRRIIRQLLTESALLGLLAGIVALLFAWAFLQVSETLYANAAPIEFGTLVFRVAPDLQIFAYVCAISLVAGILFGLAPALESSASSLSAGARGSTAGIRARRLQNLLVAAQVSLSLVLMIAGSMLIRSSIHTLKSETGYETRHVISLDFQFPEGSKSSSDRKLAEARELRTRLRALPGITAVSSAHAPGDLGFRTAAVALAAGGRQPTAQSVMYYTMIESNYFETLGIPLALGYGFSSNAQPQPSVILSESAARELWPGQNPLGRSLRLGPIDERRHNSNELVAGGPAYQVIGVARDIRGAEFDGSDSRQIYLRLPEDGIANRPLLIRTRPDAGQVIRAIDPVISSIDPQLLATSSTLHEALRRSPAFLTSTIAAAVAWSVGALGLLLALMGIYGTVSYIVLLRTREVGIRMAIGAQKRDVLRLILGESTRPVLLGLLIGMLLATGAAYLLRSVLYGVSIVDSVSFIGMSLLFLAVALLAAYPPSRRAMRIDPAVALRYE